MLAQKIDFSHYAALVKTPVEFANSVRISHACKLIDIYGKEISVTELSEKCGFQIPRISRAFSKALNQ